MIETESTNCGANAEQSKKVLSQHPLFRSAACLVSEEAHRVDTHTTTTTYDDDDATTTKRRKRKTILLMQDPTMQRRSHASFEKHWGIIDSSSNNDNNVTFLSFSPFVPRVVVVGVNKDEKWGGEPTITTSTSSSGGGGGEGTQCGQTALASHLSLSIDKSDSSAQVSTSHIWDIDRFVTLVMGEIPRMRDTPTGYGPRGKGFIVHVDIPKEVDEAYERLVIALPHITR